MVLQGFPRAARLRAPSWLDARFVIGLLLVLLSVVIGSRVLAGADRADTVYTLTHEVAAGTALTADDLRVTRVRFLDGAAGYVSAAGPKPVGWVLDRAVGTGEFLPRQALVPAPPANVRLVTVPVAPHHFPAGLGHGHAVDVYLSAKALPGGRAPAPELVLRNVTVEEVSEGGRLIGTGTVGVLLRVPSADVPRAVSAVEGGAVNLVRVPSEVAGQSAAPTP